WAGLAGAGVTVAAGVAKRVWAGGGLPASSWAGRLASVFPSSRPSEASGCLRPQRPRLLESWHLALPARVLLLGLDATEDLCALVNHLPDGNGGRSQVADKRVVS